MFHTRASWLRAVALAIGVLALTANATLGEWFPNRGGNAFGTGVYAPSYYGYNLDEMSAGYYGGGRYREYYSYGRGYGIANYPGPLPGTGLPPDYRGPLGGVYYVNPAPAAVAASPLLQGDKVAHITVELPAADAEVWIEGQPTKQAGTTRSFVSPVLNKNEQYEYRIRARWKEDGKEVEQTQRVAVHAGDNVSVGFPTGGEKKAVGAPALVPSNDK
jgi:uncharacterized protein (TIGR03000 family)